MGFVLLLLPTIIYSIFRDSDDPRPGIPESITLTVLETNLTDISNLHSYSSHSQQHNIFSSEWFGYERVLYHHTHQLLLMHKYFGHFFMKLSTLMRQTQQQWAGAVHHTGLEYLGQKRLMLKPLNPLLILYLFSWKILHSQYNVSLAQYKWKCDIKEQQYQFTQQ